MTGSGRLLPGSDGLAHVFPPLQCGPQVPAVNFLLLGPSLILIIVTEEFTTLFGHEDINIKNYN